MNIVLVFALLKIDHPLNAPKSSIENIQAESLLTTMAPSNEEKAVIQLKHEIGRIQRKQQEELNLLMDEITQHVRKDFEHFFIQKYQKEDKGANYEKLIEQLNFWQKKRLSLINERDYTESEVAKKELEAEIQFVDKRIGSYQKKAERIKKRCQSKLDEIKKVKETELRKLYESINDFLLMTESDTLEEKSSEEEELE